jgi:hypothetical protein
MGYILWIDDERNPAEHRYGAYIRGYSERYNLFVVWVKTSQQAIDHVLVHGLPDLMSLDHDLGLLDNGVEDTTMHFLNFLGYDWFDRLGNLEVKFPEWRVHSDNVCGGKNMDAFLNSLKRSQGL